MSLEVTTSPLNEGWYMKSKGYRESTKETLMIETPKKPAPKAGVEFVSHLTPEQQEEDEAAATRRYSRRPTRSSKQSHETTTKSKG
jgi:hypothetical protein